MYNGYACSTALGFTVESNATQPDNSTDMTIRDDRNIDFKPFPPLMIGRKCFFLLIVCIIPSRIASNEDRFINAVKK
tara:strand:- start:20 stop:250 length:231 start_codon:yes stop_codon:yes gene_type:complete